MNAQLNPVMQFARSLIVAALPGCAIDSNVDAVPAKHAESTLVIRTPCAGFALVHPHRLFSNQLVVVIRSANSPIESLESAELQVKLGDHVVRRALTRANGTVVFDTLPAKHDVISVRRIGYQAASAQFGASADCRSDVEVYLEWEMFAIDPLVVTTQKGKVVSSRVESNVVPRTTAGRSPITTCGRLLKENRAGRHAHTARDYTAAGTNGAPR